MVCIPLILTQVKFKLRLSLIDVIAGMPDRIPGPDIDFWRTFRDSNLRAVRPVRPITSLADQWLTRSTHLDFFNNLNMSPRPRLQVVPVPLALNLRFKHARFPIYSLPSFGWTICPSAKTVNGEKNEQLANTMKGVDFNCSLSYVDRFRIWKLGIQWDLHPPYVDGASRL
jgi:hypothetical protein